MSDWKLPEGWGLGTETYGFCLNRMWKFIFMTNKDSKDKYKQHNKRGKYFMLSDIQIKAIHGMENSEILPCTPRSIDFWITFFLNSCSSDFWNMITSCGHLSDPTFVIVFLGPCSSLHFFSYEHFCRMQPLFLCSPFLCHILSPFVMNGTWSHCHECG